MSDQPDFDSMSPEEVMRWMESLAKRQGATEGLTTSADVDIAEVDPDGVDHDEIGEYIPYGWTKEKWDAHLAAEAAKKTSQQPVATSPEPEPVVGIPEPAMASVEAPVAGGQPDFDSMSPEEMMSWMESLAKRQGATEGLTTSADMQIDEVDPDSVDMASIGEYIPHGWTKEKWDAHLAEEAARKTAQQPVAAQPESESTPEPAVASVEAPVADGQPDFDSMSPEEAMAWMESAAKRVDPNVIGLTTSANVDIPEIDPASVDMDKIGKYIPFNMTEEEFDAQEEAKKASQQSAPPPETPAEPEFDPIAEMTQQEEQEDVLDFLSSLADSGDDSEEVDLSGFGELSGLAALGETSDEGGIDSLSWLEGLSGDAEEPSFDFANLAASVDDDSEQQDPSEWLAKLAGDGTSSEAVSGVANPLEHDVDPTEWLETLADQQGANREELTTEASLDIPAPESVELEGPGYSDYSFETTDTPPPSDLGIPAEVTEAPEFDQDDPESWLDQMAQSSGDVPVSSGDDSHDQDLIAALHKGQAVDPQDIQRFLSRQLDKGLSREEPEIVDEDSTAVPAELPLWLMEQMQTDHSEEDHGMDLDTILAEETHDEVPEDISNWLQEHADEAEMEAEPDFDFELDDVEDDSEDEGAIPAELPPWLMEDVTAAEEEDILNIFAETEEEPEFEPEPEAEIVAEDFELEIDTTDPWVEAFQIESELDTTSIPQWYEQRLESVKTTDIHAVEAEESVPKPEAIGIVLQEARFPQETDLPMGEMALIPDWLGDFATATVVVEEPLPATPVFEEDTLDWIPDEVTTEDEADDQAWLVDSAPDFADITAEDEAVPDWLLDEVDESASDDIPDWMTEIQAEDDEVITPAQVIEAHTVAAVVPSPPPAPVIPEQASPAPVPIVATQIDVAATLQTARDKSKVNQFTESMQEYEKIVRANTQLDEVVSDLNKLADVHKEPAIFRVLGDALMRQGNLQTALDTYRKALNLL